MENRYLTNDELEKLKQEIRNQAKNKKSLHVMRGCGSSLFIYYSIPQDRFKFVLKNKERRYTNLSTCYEDAKIMADDLKAPKVQRRVTNHDDWDYLNHIISDVGSKLHNIISS